MSLRIRWLALGAAAAVTLSAGCSDTTETASVPRNELVRIAVATFGNEQLDPTLQGKSDVLNLLLPMYDTLLEIAPDGSLAPGLVAEWSVDDDGVTWTFKLRKGVQFHDGWGELTAADVLFSLERWTHPKSTVTESEALRQKIRDIVVVDDYTFQIITNGPQVDILYLLSPHQAASGIVFPRQYMLEKAGEDFDAQTELLNEAPIGSGPFKFVSHTPGQSIVYEAVDEHWRNTPKVKRLEFLLVPELTSRVAMLKTDAVEIVELTPDQAADVEASGFEVRDVPAAQNVGVHFVGTFRPPAEGKPTTDPRVRKALALAIDSATSLATVLGGRGELATTPWNTLATTADIDAAHFAEWAEVNNTYDPDAARQLLAEAGYPNGFSGIKLHSFTRQGAPYLPQLTEIVAAQWAEIGVEAEIVPTDYGSYREHYVNAPLDDAYNAGDAIVYSTAPRFDALGALQTYFRWEPGSVQLLKDPALDAIINEAASVSDDEARVALVTEAFDIANETWVAYPMFNANALYGVSPQVVGGWQTFAGWPFMGRMIETIG